MDKYCDNVGSEIWTLLNNFSFVYYLNTNPDTIPDYQIEGQTPHHYFGCSVDFAGDINNDGYKEIVIGEHQRWGEEGLGKVYIYSYLTI